MALGVFTLYIKQTQNGKKITIFNKLLREEVTQFVVKLF